MTIGDRSNDPSDVADAGVNGEDRRLSKKAALSHDASPSFPASGGDRSTLSRRFNLADHPCKQSRSR